MEYDRYWEVLIRRHGKQPGTRQMIELLGLGKKHGYDRLQEAVVTALATGCGDVAAVRYLLTAGSSAPPRWNRANWAASPVTNDGFPAFKITTNCSAGR